jgi:DNA-binding Xre family transcriptional regulator
MISVSVNDEVLREAAQEQGLKSFEAVAEKAKGMGISLGVATLYNFSQNSNWTRETLERVCSVLDCEPSRFLEVRID